MASLVACALIEESGQERERDLRRGIDRVLFATFWRPSYRTGLAPVVPLFAHLATGHVPPRR
jgi:hypothetical protein